jgi:hypothetical protein
MPQLAVAILLGSLSAFYGNELPDRFWSAIAPLLLLLCCYCPGHRFLLLAAAAYLWSSALFHHHLDHRLIAWWRICPRFRQGVSGCTSKTSRSIVTPAPHLACCG